MHVSPFWDEADADRGCVLSMFYFSTGSHVCSRELSRAGMLRWRFVCWISYMCNGGVCGSWHESR